MKISDDEIITALSKIFQEYFIDYRKRKDTLKMINYLMLAKCYSNYLLKPTKTSLNDLEEDEGLSDQFIQKLNELIISNSESNNASSSIKFDIWPE